MKMKYYGDRRRKTIDMNWKKGDRVLLRNMGMTNKQEPIFDPKYYTVTSIKGNMITAINEEGNQITRNVSFFKRI